MTTRASRLALGVLLSVLVGILAGCGGDDSPESPRAKASAEAPKKELVKGTCWDNDQLPDALDEEAFDAWVKKYAGDDEDLGDSMRDDAAFSKEIDCTKPHSLELYNVVALAPQLTAKITEYADLLDRKSALYRQIRDQVTARCLAGSSYGRAQRKAGGLPVQLAPRSTSTAASTTPGTRSPQTCGRRGRRSSCAPSSRTARAPCRSRTSPRARRRCSCACA